MHFGLFVISSTLLCFLIVANTIRSKRLSISLLKSVLRPSQVILGYMLFFICVGSLLFHYEKVQNSALLIDSLDWHIFPIVILTITVFFSIIVTSTIKLGPSYSKFKKSQDERKIPWEAFALCFAFAAATIENASLILIATGLYIAGSANGRLKSPVFLAFLVIGIAILLPTFAFGKRLLIFPMFVVLMIAWRDSALRWQAATLLLVGCVIVILPLSIMRGYGNYDANGFFEAIAYVGDYISADFFLAAFGNNIEANSFYFHGLNALQLTYHSGDYRWGETIVNMFFLGSNLYGFDDGLQSSIHIYTYEYNPRFREIGGSYPIMILSEFFMNFGVFTLFLFPLFLIHLDALWRITQIIHSGTVRFSLEAILLYATLLLVRGSSFDLFMYHLILLSAPILTIVWVVSKSKRLPFRRVRFA